MFRLIECTNYVLTNYTRFTHLYNRTSNKVLNPISGGLQNHRPHQEPHQFKTPAHYYYYFSGREVVPRRPQHQHD